MANPTSNFGWQMPTNTDLVKDLPADFEVFGQAVDTDLADLKGGTTGQVLSKTSGNDLDFTWVTPTDQTPLTTKGDLFGYSTADARIPVGADGTVLTADSNETLGLKWAAAAGGGALNFISRTTFSNVASQAFDDVFTSTYKAYRVVIENINGATGTDDLQMQFRYAGPTTQTTNYYGPRYYLIYVGSITADSMNNTSEMKIIDQIGSGAEPTVGTIDFYQVGQSSQRPNAYAQVNCAYAGVFEFSYAWCSVARTYTGFLLKSSSSNITGTVSVYGLATS
jgi:hypothetical protein